MKKKALLAVALAGAMTLPMAACGPSVHKGVEGVLSVSMYVAGYGEEWIDEAVRLYKEDNPGVEVDVESSALAMSSVKTQLENGNCGYDVVLVSAVDYPAFVARGVLEDLTGMYDSTIPGTERTVREVIHPEAVTHYSAGDLIYGVPWQYNYAAGLIYNRAMFEQYGWTVPETMDEFWTLCDTITRDTANAVSPICYSGADGMGYMYNNFPQWLLEYYGMENMKEFYQAESPAVYENQREGRDKIYKTIARLTKGVTASGAPIAVDGSEGAIAITAQTNFVNGRAAMITCGQWFPTEMSEYIELRNLDVGYIPMPHINGDRKSGDGTLDTSNVRFSTDNGVFAIPATAVNKDLAKDFLTHMLTSQSYSSFVRTNNGLLRPVQNIPVDETGFAPFTQEVFDYFYADGEAEVLINYNMADVFTDSSIDVFFAYDGAYFTKITGEKTYEAALAMAATCVGDELARINGKWDSSTQSWK